MSGMPAALQADIDLGHAHFLTTDRGAVRGARARTSQSRGNHFAHYLTSRGVDVHNIGVALAEPLKVLKGYLLQVIRGNNLLNKLDLDDQTLRNYFTDGAKEIERLTGRPCSIMNPATFQYKRPTMHPYLLDVIQQRASWKEPLKRKEAITMPIIGAIRDTAHDIASTHGTMASFLSVEYTVYDWERVVLYTGSRIAEYGQSSSATYSKLKLSTKLENGPDFPLRL